MSIIRSTIWRTVCLCALFVLIGLGLRQSAAKEAPAPPADFISRASQPCLTSDPYSLEDLRDTLSSDTPPSTPVNIGRYITVEYVGEGTILGDDDVPTQPERIDTAGTTDPTEPPIDDTNYGQVDFLVFNSRTQFEFKVSMQEDMLRGIYNCHEDNGLIEATEGFEEEPTSELAQLFLPVITDSRSSTNSLRAPAAPDGWSNGSDTRVRLGATTTWPWRTIAQFRSNGSTTHNSNCSGTLIGPRHIITAAHCMNQQGTSNWFSPRITPGKNGFGTSNAQEPYGSTRVTLTPPPGQEVWYFTPWQWRNPNTTHWQWDWGLLVIPDRLGDATGWMGYFAATGSYLQNVSKWNRGYAQCNTARGNSPANCVNGALYGDTNRCNIGSFLNQGADGWNRRITVSCDMSGGHSGSPVYFYYYSANQNRWVPVVTMVVSTESCATCGVNDNFPNGMVRLTPSRISTISWLRETFP